MQTLSYWADDAVCLFPELPPIKGKQEIRQMLSEAATIPGSEVSWEPRNLEKTGKRRMEMCC